MSDQFQPTSQPEAEQPTTTFEEMDRRTKHQHNISFGEYVLTSNTIRTTSRTWPVAGATAEFRLGSEGDAPTGSGGLLSKVLGLGRNKAHVLIEFPDGERLMIKAPAKLERQARGFAVKVTKAGEMFARAQAAETSS